MAQEVSVNNSTSVGVTISGAVQAATQAQVDAGIIANKYVSPKTLNDWSGGSSAWGSITGTLSAQTDLQAALDAKWSVTGTSTLTGATTIDLNGNTLDFITSQNSNAITTLNNTNSGSSASYRLYFKNNSSRGAYLQQNSSVNTSIVGSNGFAINTTDNVTNLSLGTNGVSQIVLIGSSNTIRNNVPTLFAPSGSITSGSVVDVRGTGTSTNKAFRVADSGDTERFYIQDNGTTVNKETFVIGGDSQAPNIYTTSDGTSINSSSGKGLLITSANTTFGNAGQLNIVNTFNSVSNNQRSLKLTATFSPTGAGTNIYSGLFINNTYNANASWNGTIYGIYYGPTVTSVGTGKHYALYLASGNVNMSGLPISSAGLSSGDLWNNSGVINIV